ncbi:MAG: PilZ domain-containing protein [Candidatus Polarisedimenticolaceae bacterium]|nr:PilZ domain-containing protein [Candidatus Polarisedimenticolaceae bacterium]
MEHRYALRKPVTLDVVVTYQALGLVHGRTMNVGLGGMYIETGRVELPVNALIKTAFFLNENGMHKPCSADAMVVHSCSCGSGLMFNDLDDELHAALQRLLDCSHDNARPDQQRIAEAQI